MKKKIISILLIITASVIISSCEQARNIVVTYNCKLTHYYSRHTGDLEKVKDYITRKRGYKVGSSFSLSVYGKNNDVCIEEADSQAKVYFDNCTCFFREEDLRNLLGEETEFEYSFCRVKEDGDTLKIISYQYNMN